MKLAWTIAGFDPSGAAGLQVDLRTFAALGVHCCTVSTAIAVQNFSQFISSTPTTSADLQAQLTAISSPQMPRPSAVKIGVLPTASAVDQVFSVVAQLGAFVVLDPVLCTSSGGCLSTPDVIPAMIRALPYVDLWTPNIPEAEQLLGTAIRSAEDMPGAAAALLALGAKRVLLKGGHLSGSLVHDVYCEAGHHYWLTSSRQKATVRGTGCALASAIAAYVTLGKSLPDSLVLARAFVSRGIRTAVPSEAGPALLGWDLALSQDDLPWQTGSMGMPGRGLGPLGITSPAFASCGPNPLGFYPVVDSAAWVRRVVDHGATTVQLRIKDLHGEALRHELAAAIAACRPRGVRLFINDYWQLAIELGAYGLHLGQEDLETADLPAIAKAGLRLGISTHCYSEAAVAHALRPSYVALGPIFPTTCKSLRFGPQGWERLAEWSRLLPYPIVAIGGLTYDHIEAALQAGADGIAVISDITQAAKPDERIQQWLQRCNQQ